MNEKNDSSFREPKILVIGVGGGGNNAIDRMIDASLTNVSYLAINTDIQILEACKASCKLQIGQKLTKGYGAGADSDIGEAAALENEEDIQSLINGYDLCIITCGMGGGTGTGAAPVIAKCCTEENILTIGVVTTPFSFESTPRITAAQRGLERLRSHVDTLFVIPNDKLISLSDKPLDLDNAFTIADSVLKYTIEGITNIIYNKGLVNLDFNDLRTTLAGKGIGHLGIGIVDADQTVLEATKLAINSPLLDTNIHGATNLLINTCGKIDIIGLNEAITYVREMAGNTVNIIWGTVSSSNYDEHKIVVTLIATGMHEEKQDVPPTNAIPTHLPSFNHQNTVTNKKPLRQQEVELIIPSFLVNSIKK